MTIPKPLQKLSGFSDAVQFGELYSQGTKPYIRIRPAFRTKYQTSHKRPPKYKQVTANLIEVEVWYELEVRHVSHWNPLIFNDMILRCEGKGGLRKECSFWQKSVKTNIGLRQTSRFNADRSTEFNVKFRFTREELTQKNLPMRIQPVISFEYYHNRRSDFVRMSLELPDIVLHEEPYIMTKNVEKAAG